MPKTEEKREPRPKKKKNASLELLRAITKSMAGAIPGISEDTRDVIDDSLARPLSGMASQILAEDPNEPGKLVIPPLHNLKRSLNADARRKAGLSPEKMAMPGLIQDSLSLPTVLGGGPQWAQDAAASADRIHSAIDKGMDLSPPQGFRQHALNSAGMMASQIPLGKAKEAAEMGKGALQLFRKYGKKALASPIEFFSPTIDPRMSNYLMGSAAGGALGALGDETGEIIEERPLPRAISRAKGGKIGPLTEVLKALSANPDSTVRQTKHVIGEPIEEILHAANEGERRGVIDTAESQRIRQLMDTGDEDSLADALIDLQKKLFSTPKPIPTDRRVVTSVAAPQGLGSLPRVESDVPLLEPAAHVLEVSGVPTRARPAEAPAGYGLRDELSRRPPDQGDVPDADWKRIRNRMKGWKIQSVADLDELLPTQTTEELKVKIPPMGKWTNWPDDPKARPMKLDVLKNPKSQEDVVRWAGRDVQKIRFMTDQDGDTYVWDADKAIHNQVLEALGLSRKGLFHEMTDTPIPPKMFDQFFFSNPWE
jgi:hypothetical protein